MIEAVDLTKRSDEGRLIVDAVNFKVATGEIYCLLGAKGAGKSTTINMVLNLVQPTSGRIFINGLDVSKNSEEARRLTAYVSDDVLFYGNFTARQNLDFFARLTGKRGLKKEDYYALLREVGLQDASFERQMKDFTKPMRQKVGIAVAVMKDSPVVVLDEPTLGLDPNAVSEITEILIEMRGRNKAVLMSTQDIFRVKEVADRVAIMKEGRKAMERTRAELANEDLQALYLDYMGSGRSDTRRVLRMVNGSRRTG
jgi:ABC-2 type transport system ATP-binding protein